MPTNTYVALDKVTVSSNTSTVEFLSVTQSYTDLIIVIQPIGSVAGINAKIGFNADSSSAYSATFMSGYSTSSTESYRYSNQSSNVFLQGDAVTNANYGNSTIVQIQNYSNSTTYKTWLCRSNTVSTQSAVDASVGLYRSTSPITRITITTNTDFFAAGSTFSLYGIAATSVGAKATGGIISSDSQYYYHTFLSSGTFTPTQSLSCDALIVAGGGAGGASNGGGGGAGGLMYGTSLSLTSSTNYTVTIGAGGNGAAYPTASTNGSDSVFSTYTAIGGGAGGNEGSLANEAGKNGGSAGAGAGYRTGGAGTNAGGTATQGSSSPFTGYGNNGGSGLRDATAPLYTGGGGGGADAAGANATDTTCGAGGNGKTYSISGSSVTYAGGGGGGGGTTNPTAGGAGGTGGGGAGGTYTGGGAGTGAGTAGTANLGGGGGGGANGGNGANGGSGIVIVRYAK